MKHIICTGTNGRAVVYGTVIGTPMPGEAVVIEGARMVLRWDEACGGLFGLAANGPKNDTRLTAPVTTACIVRQMIEVSPEATAALDALGVYGG